MRIWTVLPLLWACTPQDTDDTDEVPVTPTIVADIAWLQNHLDEVQVVDVRSAEAYEDAHIEGALWVPWDSLRAEVDGVGGQVASSETVATLLSEAGVRDDALVVAYGDRAGRDSGRLAWTLHYYGHAEAVILDGAWQGWLRADGATATGPATATPSTWTAGPTSSAVRVTAAQVTQALDDPTVTLLDVRTQDEFDDGHIPGAVHVEWTENVHIDGNNEGLLRDVQHIVDLYPGVQRDEPVYVYCRSGARAALPYVALRWAGFSDVRLYDGSWNEWSIDGPVEK